MSISLGALYNMKIHAPKRAVCGQWVLPGWSFTVYDRYRGMQFSLCMAKLGESKSPLCFWYFMHQFDYLVYMI